MKTRLKRLVGIWPILRISVLGIAIGFALCFISTCAWVKLGINLPFDPVKYRPLFLAIGILAAIVGEVTYIYKVFGQKL